MLQDAHATETNDHFAAAQNLCLNQVQKWKAIERKYSVTVRTLRVDRRRVYVFKLRHSTLLNICSERGTGVPLSSLSLSSHISRFVASVT